MAVCLPGYVEHDVKEDRMVDVDGFRPNVGIILADSAGTGRVLWARRVGGQDAWQFPQGGINEGETPEEALYRELHEEVGLRAKAHARTHRGSPVIKV